VSKTLQHRRDVWMEFASEPADITTSSSQKAAVATSAGDGSLSLFPSEAATEAPGQPREPIDQALASFSEEQPSTSSTESFVTRWVIPVAAAFICGSASLLVTLFVLTRWSPHDLDQPQMMTVSDGIPADLLASTDRIEIEVPVRNEVTPGRPNVTRAPVTPPVPPMPALSESLEPRAASTGTSAPEPQEISLVPEALTTLPGAEIPDDEEAVRRAIRSYEQAYERVDAAAIAKLWPTVDQRALSRAFDTVTSQGIGLESCAIALNGEQATAQCRGRHKFVGKANNSVTIASEQQWLFKMRRAGGEWRIEDVSPSQISAPTAAGRGQY
jgi:hypothetical protein